MASCISCPYLGDVQKPNAIAGVFDLAFDARDDKALWDVHEIGAKSGWRRGTSFRRELETREVGSQVARLYAFCVPLRSRQDRHIIIELKLIVGRLTLRFSPIRNDARNGKRKRRRTRLGTSRQYRKHRKGLRRLHRDLEEPFSDVPLVWDDDELRALVALRCIQQGYHADAALEELRSYARKLRVPVRVVDDVLGRVVEHFVSGPPGGLPAHIWAMKRAVLARDAELRAGTEELLEDAELRADTVLKARRKSRKLILHAGGKLFTVLEAARALRVSRRTLYHWLQHGIIAHAEKAPYQIAQKEVERVRERIKAKPGTLYRRLMELWGCSYDAARVRVARRRAKGVPNRKIIEEAGAFNPVDEDEEREELRVAVGLN